GVSYLHQCIFFFQAEDGIRDKLVTGVQTCALPISDAPVGLFGMSAALGPLAYRTPGNPWETDRGVGISESTAQKVDDEVRDLVRSEERRVGKECRSGWEP